jgi:hypothetical protein
VSEYESRPYEAASESPAKATASILPAALAYAKMGIPVFPCHADRKNPLTSNGFKDATTDARKIERWWGYWPDANLAMATGAPGFNVLDIDVRATGSGMEIFEELQRMGLLAGLVGLAKTPCGGLHAYFPGTEERCSKLRDRHVDFKAAGGYAMAPPSWFIATPEEGGYEGGYEWLLPLQGVGAPLDWPRITSIYQPASAAPPRTWVGRGKGGGLASWVAELTEGERNDGVFWAACEALRTGQTDLTDIRTAALNTGLDPRSVDDTLRSARRTVNPR